VITACKRKTRKSPYAFHTRYFYLCRIGHLLESSLFNPRRVKDQTTGELDMWYVRSNSLKLLQREHRSWAVMTHDLVKRQVYALARNFTRTQVARRARGS